MNDDTFPCFLVTRDGEQVTQAVTTISVADLPPGDVIIDVQYSSLNFKDALAATGHPGVVRHFPHVPGIDCAGIVAATDVAGLNVGQPVIVTGYEFGAERWGGWSGRVRVPAEWVVPLPAGLTLHEAMIYGTAGFTAAQSVAALQHHGVTPEAGEIVVTGATGGVGSVAVSLLSHLGYRVAAVSGKSQSHDRLREMGAARILGRDEVDDQSDRPLLKVAWAGAIDTVGGNILATLLRTTQQRGCVTACGLVAGAELPMTVYPFILRGVTLQGIDSAACPMQPRLEIWHKLAGPWKPNGLNRLAQEVTFAQLAESVQQMLSGQVVGRTVVVPATD